MVKLEFDATQFVNIPLQDCLNYDVFQNLEVIIKNAVDSVIKSQEKYNLKTNENEQKVMLFLQHILLRISTNETWIRLSKENNLNQLYLYKVIRKYLYLKDPEFLN